MLIACTTVLPTAEAMRRGLKRTGKLDANAFVLGADAIRDDFYYDAHVPMSYSFPSEKGPFKTRGFTDWTVADWNSDKAAYEFPLYPCYYKTFKAKGAGCETSARSSSSRWSTTLTDLEVRVVATKAGRIEVATTGSGPTVLLVHGIPGSWRQCVPLAEDLSPSFHIVMPSRPGYGRTPVSTGRTYDEQADAYVSLLDSLGIDSCSVLGISGGGPSALALAARHPDRVTGLVLACAMAPHLIERPLVTSLIRVPGLPSLVNPVLRAGRRRRIRQPEAIDRYLSSALTPEEYQTASADARVRDDLVRFELSHLSAPAGVQGLRNDLAQIVGSKGRPANATIGCPAQLLYGTHDAVISMSHAEFYGTIVPDAEVVVFENAGHVFCLTRRSECSAAIRAFFERCA